MQAKVEVPSAPSAAEFRSDAAGARNVAAFHGNGTVDAAPADFAGFRPRPVRASGPAPEETLAELARVVSSPDFRASPRNRRALEYIVQRYLEGREDELGAYHIATRVYGRQPGFDPIKDPIVRIEMAGVRRDLEMYYLKSGARNPLRISIPKGGYVPRVTPAPQAAKGAAADAGPLSGFMVGVLRAALCAMDGQHREAAYAWQELLRCDPDRLANLHESVLREIGDEEVTRRIVDGVLRAARGKLSD